jgi:hypothetical protein
MVTSDNGNKDSGKGSNKDGRNDNNHHSSMDTCSNMGSHMGSNTSSYRVEGNNMVQDRVASPTVNNTIPPPDFDGIG